jgi:2-oxoglutarate dehydrogenase E2 component (dihydrolipoamide succinyltransferase)
VKFEIKIPAVGESITEATIASWNKKDGDMVNRDEVLLTLETDKASVEVVAENAGKLSIKVKEGQTIAIGSVVGEIDGDGKGAAAAPAASTPAAAKPASAPAAATTPAVPPQFAAPPAAMMNNGPAANKMIQESGMNVSGLTGSGKDGRITKGDIITGQMKSPAPAAPQASAAKESKPTGPAYVPPVGQPGTSTREPMSKLRQTIARRLVEAQSTAAILTTFNEIDMTNVMALRAKYKEKFKEKQNVNLGFMGFFVKASLEALKAFPKVNAYIDGIDVVYNHFYNVGIAVGTEKGLIVPVIKNANTLSIADVEKSIKYYAEKARDGKITMDDLSGGTFTISNGGVYGSLMSTPILNPPQSAILGLHKIEERPVAINGKVEIRSMMYVALSYDHRIIDGGESVSFLVRIKEGMEDPARLLLEI